MNEVDLLLVRRLVRHYGWWPSSFYAARDAREQLRRARPIHRFKPEIKREDDPAWHFGRVKHFAMRLEKGRPVDPIIVDNYCDHGHIYAEPLIVDGHHRFAAHVLSGQRAIPALYSGRVDLLEYLRGDRLRKPV